MRGVGEWFAEVGRFFAYLVHMSKVALQRCHFWNSNCFKQTEFDMHNCVYCERAQVEDIDRLSVIHVSGTKGKGSTCAFAESILRAYGYKTGFFR